jgi:prevent-host-death family protein
MITASKLRENIYRILDEAVETGAPVEVVRKGVILRIVPETKSSKLSRLKKRLDFVGDSGDLVQSDWLQSDGHKEWLEEWTEPK